MDDDFTAFQRRTFAHVWRVLGRAGVRRVEEREELAQDVYLVAYQKRATRDPEVPELAWIGSIARNLGLRYCELARTRKEQPVHDPENMIEPIAPGSSPEVATIGRSQILAVLECLRDDLREVFEMSEVEQFTIAEIAATLRKRPGTVSTMLRRAQEEIEAAVARLAARERRANRALMLPMLGASAVDWRAAGQLFDGPPPGMAEQVWRGVCRRLASGAVAGTAAAGAGLVAKGALFGSGAALGGGAVAAAFLLAATPAPAPPISRAPEAASVALVTTASATTAPAAPAPTMAAAPSSIGAAAPVTTVAAGLDPREQQLLSQAESAIAAGKLDEARKALAEYDRLFPGARAKLRVDRTRLGAKLNAAMNQPSAPEPAAGRAPHRLMGTDD